MKEILIVFYAIILQLGIAVITLGVITYFRHRKKSLKYFLHFMISLQSIQLALLFKACLDYSEKKSLLLNGFMRFFDLFGMILMLFVLCIFPFYIKGCKPHQLTKLASALITTFFTANYLFSIVTGTKFYMMINRLITSAVILYVVVFIMSFVRYIGNQAMRKVMIYLGGISILFAPFIFMEFIRASSHHFQNLWFIEPLSLPAYLFVLSCSGLYLIRKYFDVPSFIDPEKDKLSEFFIERYNITGREEEIIMLLRKGKAYKEIAEALVIAYKTVDAHIQNIYSKTNVNNRKQLLNLIETSNI